MLDIHSAAEIVRNAAFITGLAVVMLLLIEYAGAALGGKLLWIRGKSPALQIAAAALLGAVPGCVGGFVAVSLYVQGAAGMGALCAALIATMGDEALVMFALFPKDAMLVQALLLALALAVGFCVNKYAHRVKYVKASSPPPTHLHNCKVEVFGNITENLRHISMQRAVLAAGLMLAIIAVISGAAGHSHGEHMQEMAHDSDSVFEQVWINALFAVLAAAALVITLWAAPHFLHHHLWRHVIVRHFVRIFLWSLGALAAAALAEVWLPQHLMHGSGQVLMFAAAIVVGIIPASGPHLAFAALYANGSIGLPILLTSMLVQDGHAGLPLLSSSKKTFILIKSIKIAMAIIIAAAVSVN